MIRGWWQSDEKLKSFLKNPQTIVGFAILTVMVLLAVFAPVICPGNPLFSVENRFRRRIRSSLWNVAFGASLLSLIVGIALGALSGYIGAGWTI